MHDEPESNTIHAAIYARVSTEDQGEGYSLQDQLKECQIYAKKHGLTVWTSHIFTDTVSGMTLKRPGLQALWEMIRRQGVQAVIMWRPDRMSRRAGESAFLRDEWEKAGIQLHFAEHPLDPSDEGKLMFLIQSGVAEYEHAKILDRSLRGKRGRFESGLPDGHHAPYGYRWERIPHRSHLVVDDQEAAIVRRIFQSVLQGMTVRSIAKQLTAEAIPTRCDVSGKGWKKRPKGHWERSVVGKILHYTGYIGIAYENKSSCSGPDGKRQWRPREEWLPIPMPVIIDEETFAAVAVQLSHHKRTASRNRKHPYLFTGGTLRCERCGRGMFGRMASGGSGYCFYYQCNTSAHNMDGVYCRGTLAGRPAEVDVWRAIEHILSDPQLTVRSFF